MYITTEVIIWLVIVEVLGILAFPLAFNFLKFLPDKGYTVAKTLGILVTGYVVWLLGMIGLPFTALTSWLLAIVLLGGSYAWLMLRDGRKLTHETITYIKEHRWLIVTVEALFVLAYLYLVTMRSYMPDIRDQEKFGDFAFLNSMARHDKLPPTDPWMSGYTINYYYFSHFLMAMLTKMGGLEPSISFNLTVPLIFALTAISAFGVVYNLVIIARRKAGSPAVLSGLASSLFICVLGNLDAVRQILSAKGGSFAFNWWKPSRVIYDYIPVPIGNGLVQYQWSETINEFPMFSFLLADMHPHVMALPFILLVVAAALNLLISPAIKTQKADAILNFGLLALAIGALYFLNTWDFPTFLLLTLIAAAVRELRVGANATDDSGARGSGLWRVLIMGGTVINTTWARTVRWLGFAIRLSIIALALFLPFHLTFVSLLGENFIPETVANLPILGQIAKYLGVVGWDRTPLFGYLLVFGIFILPIVTFMLIKLWPYLKAPYAYLNDEEDEKPIVKSNLGYYVSGFGLLILLISEVLFFGNLAPDLALVVGLVAVVPIAAGVGLLATNLLTELRPLRLERELQLALAATILVMTALGWYLRFELYAPLIVGTIFAGLLIWFENKNATSEKPWLLADTFGLALILIPGAISWIIEIVYIRDIFNTRLNTLFKFYYQAWVMYGLASAYFSWRIIAWAWQRRPFERTNLNYAEVTEQPASAFSSAPQRALLQTQSSTLNPQPLLQLRPALAANGAMNGNIAFSFGFNTLDNFKLDREQMQQLTEKAQQAEKGKPWWRWLWIFGLLLLVLAGMVYPILGPYEKTGQYAKRLGLDGTNFVKQEYPAIYQAIQWMKTKATADPSFEGVIVETQNGDWADWSIFSTFSSFPSVMGWNGHENQWRGGKKETLQEVGKRSAAIEEIYSTTDITRTQQLLQQYNVRYVIVGPFETGQQNGGYRYAQQPKNYSREGLAKFRSFMKVVYEQNGVTIYERQ